MSTEHNASDRSKGCYEVWSNYTPIGNGWQTVQGAQQWLDRIKRRTLGTSLEIFYVHRIPTADEKETFHVTKTGRDPTRRPLLRSQMLGENDARRIREGLDSDTGTGSQTVARLREALARSIKDNVQLLKNNAQLLKHVLELEEELNKEITVHDSPEK